MDDSRAAELLERLKAQRCFARRSHGLSGEECVAYVARRISSETRTSQSPAGEPGSELGREAVLDAAGELLVTHGLAGLTLQAVAKRAHVGRRSIERWWPTEEALALDVLHHEWLALAGHIRHGAREFGL
ncbi:MAG: TetR family transcriptional regulator [Solirubrobacteraceae bacterium]